MLPPLPAAVMLAVLYETTKVLAVGGSYRRESLGLLWHSISAAWFSFPVFVGLLTGLILVAVLLRAREEGRARVAPSALIVLVVAAVLGLALPYGEHGLLFINVRFQLLAGVLISVAFLPEFRVRAHGRVAGLVLGALFAARLAVMLIAWSRTGPYLADVRSIVAQIPPDARMGEVVLHHAPPGLSPWIVDLTWPTDYHFPVYLAAISDRFVIGLFDKPGQQPLAAVPAEVPIERAMHKVRAVMAGEAPHDQLGPALDHFDMMVLTGTWGGIPPTLLDGRLVRVAARPGVALYKVVPAPR